MAEDSCVFCEEQEGFEKDLIKRYRNWTAFVSLEQHYLGRSVVKLNRHIVDLFEVNEKERKELFETAMPELKEAITKAFDPDLFNYASLGNSIRHLHLHVIPRYKDKRQFKGTTFRDLRWGHNYKPYKRGFEITEETRHAIAQKIKGEI